MLKIFNITLYNLLGFYLFDYYRITLILYIVDISDYVCII